MSETADEQDNFSIRDMVIAAVILAVIGLGGWLLYTQVINKKPTFDPISQQYDVTKLGKYTSTDYGFEFVFPAYWFGGKSLRVAPVEAYERESGTAYNVGIDGYAKYTGGFVSRDWKQTPDQMADRIPLGSVTYNSCDTFNDKKNSLVQVLYEADGVCAKLFGNTDPVNGAGAYFVVEKRFDTNPHTGDFVFMNAPIKVAANNKASINHVYDAATRKAIVDFAKSIKELSAPAPEPTPAAEDNTILQ